MKKVTIDPITRLEGHGKIEIFLDEAGDVENAYFVIPELRGFEQFCVGRAGGGDAAHHQPHLRRLSRKRTTWRRPRRSTRSIMSSRRR